MPSPPEMLAALKDAEAAYRAGAAAPSPLRTARRACYHFATYSQSILGWPRREEPDPEMRARALENLPRLLSLDEPIPYEYSMFIEWASERPRDYRLAHTLLGEWERRFPEDPQTQRSRCKLGLATGNFREALEVAEGLLAGNPEDKEAKNWKEEARKAATQWCESFR